MEVYASTRAGQGATAIPTEYAGVPFRSRLEARWAMVFDHLGIRWEYEAEGYEYSFDDDDATWRYLPDFWLPDLGYWCEVKGDVHGVTDDYLHMLGHVGHFLPGVNNSDGERGVLLLGGIPDVRGGLGDDAPGFTLIGHRKGCAIHRGVLLAGRVRVSPWRVHWDRWPDNECDEWDLPRIGAWRLWDHEMVETHYAEAALPLEAYAKARSARWWK